MIKLIGIPYDANASFLRGPAKAPAFIRLMHMQGASNAMTERGNRLDFGKNLIDVGDMFFDDQTPSIVFNSIQNQVLQLLEDGSKLISLGGDHSVTYPIISAFAKHYDHLHILHFDAHTDLYDNFEDNYYSHASPFARVMEHGLVASLTQVGIRTLCEHQRSQVDRFGVQVVEMKDYERSFLTKIKGPLYISFDLDVLDPAYAPGVSHHEPGGLTTREIIACLHGLDVEVVGADIVELNPDRDYHNQTSMVAYKVLKEIWALM